MCFKCTLKIGKLIKTVNPRPFLSKLFRNLQIARTNSIPSQPVPAVKRGPITLSAHVYTLCVSPGHFPIQRPRNGFNNFASIYISPHPSVSADVNLSAGWGTVNREDTALDSAELLLSQMLDPCSSGEMFCSSQCVDNSSGRH